jgi:hypothetical protein
MERGREGVDARGSAVHRSPRHRRKVDLPPDRRSSDRTPIRAEFLDERVFERGRAAATRRCGGTIANTPGAFPARDRLGQEATMRQTSKALKHDLEQLRTLRDELRVWIHLGAMDARDTFHELSANADDVLREAGGASHAAVRSLIERFQALSEKHAGARGGDGPDAARRTEAHPRLH